MFGVVVPYFQRKPGLLRRAVRSVLDQVGVARPIIIIVDDGSPVPARDELSLFSGVELNSIQLIEQSNAGVSAARNRALDTMPDIVDKIAFLDPDDAWRPRHLLNATCAFETGSDFYFTDFMPVSQTKSRFLLSNIRLDQHEKILTGENIFKYHGNFRNDILKSTFVGTSTVVLNREIIKDQRFHEKITAFEDLLFWFSILKPHHTIMFSSAMESEYGKGVGLIHNSSWGSKRSMRIALDKSIMLQEIGKSNIADMNLNQWINHERRDCRSNFARTLLHRLRRFQPIDLESTLRFITLDKKILTEIVRTFI